MSLKVFITGATGFVGNHLINLLNSSECILFGTSFPEKPENFRSFGRGNFFHLDLRAEREISELIKKIQPDWIFHLAALSNVRHSWKKRKETLETNLMGTFFLLEAVRKYAPKVRILFISSSDVYGVLSPIENVLSEEDPPQVVSPYAFTKVSGEILSKFYAKIEDLDIVIVRSFPHTGPGQSADFVCSDWACQIAKIEKGLTAPVIKVGNLEVKRDYSDVRDVIRAYVLLIEKGKKGEVYNVCSGTAVPLREILDILISYSTETIKVEIDSKKLRKADISFLLGDNKKIKKETSWVPEIPLKQTLFDLLEYWRRTI